jgi:hypothetical protein
MPTPIWEWEGSYAYSYLGVRGILCLLLFGSGRDLMPTFVEVPIGVRSLSLSRSSCKIPLFCMRNIHEMWCLPNT